MNDTPITPDLLPANIPTNILATDSIPNPDVRSRLPRLVFLGAGRIGQRRMESVAASNLAEIVGVADPVKDNITEAQRIALGAKLMSNPEELFLIEADGVVIATPSALHADQSVAWLKRGVAVFCQKPLGRTASETRRVVEAARAADRLLGVDLSYRFTAGMKQIRELISNKQLGDIYAVNLVFHNAYGPDKPWFFDPALSGGGCVIDLGVHLVDLALWVLGFPEVTNVTSRLFAKGRRLRNRQKEVEDYAVAQLDLADGVTAQLACSWNLHAGTDAVIEATFYGTTGGVTLRNVDGSFHDFTAERFSGTKREILSTPSEAERTWGGRAVIDWTKRLADNHTFDSSNEGLVQVAAVLDRIYAG